MWKQRKRGTSYTQNNKEVKKNKEIKAQSFFPIQIISEEQKLSKKKKQAIRMFFWMRSIPDTQLKKPNCSTFRNETELEKNTALKSLQTIPLLIPVTRCSPHCWIVEDDP